MRMLEPGDVIAEKYQVKGLIGRGGMGEVYLVRHALTGRRFALKVLAHALVGTTDHPSRGPHSLSRAPRTDASQRLVREALAAGRVEHRNVVDVFDVGEHHGTVYLVMEYLEGRPMSELLEAGELSDRAVLSLMLRAMDGVAAAHDHGIVHRDLKPENIFVCMGPRGELDEPRVMDFGISRLPDQLGGSGDTVATGFVVGTPHFMCLEQLEGARDLDARVDVYALGVSLYRAFSGRVPFEGENLGVLSQRIAQDTPVALGSLRPDLPQALTQTVMKAMAKRRENRHPNVRALARDLEPFVAGLSDVPLRERRARQSNTGSLSRLAPLPPPGSAPMPPALTVPPTRRLSVSPWFYVAASVPLAAATVWWLSRPPAPAPVASAPAPAVVAAPAAAPARHAEPQGAEARPLAARPLVLNQETIVAPPQEPEERPPVPVRRAVRPARPAATVARSTAAAVRPATPAVRPAAPAAVAAPAAPSGPAAPAPGDDLMESAPRRVRTSIDESDPYR
jgi:serine/threonine protein kinase